LRNLRLGDVLDIQNGFAFDSNLFSQTEGMPLIRIRDLKVGVATDIKYKGDFEESFRVKKGDYLIGMDGEFRCYKWKGEDALLNQRVCRLVNFDSKVHPEYIFYGINLHLAKIERNTAFVTVKHISSKQIKEINFPFPSLQEQIQIANILSKAEALINQRKECLRLSDEFLKSKFLEMFGDPIQGNTFEKVSLETLIDLKRGISYGIVQRGDTRDNGIPVVRIRDVEAATYRVEEFVKTLQSISDKYKRTILEGGEILISIRGTVGKLSIAPDHTKGWNISREVAIIPVVAKIEKLFLLFLLRSHPIQQRILGDVKGVAQSGVNLSDLRQLPVIIPPKQLQSEFADIVQKTELLKAQYETSLQELENLYASLSQRAFKGELELKSDTKVVLLQTDGKEEDYFKKRKALACYIINQSLGDDKFGDTKFEKLLNLSDQYGIQRSLGQAYYQNVAGPYDTFTKLFYLQIEKEKLYKRTRRNRQTIFTPDINHNKTFTAGNYFSKDELSRVDTLIAYFKKYTYEQPEIISTLYAVWNNRIIRQQQITDEVLKQDFLDWDEKKKKYKDRLDAALAWMKKENIIPNGWGKLVEKPKGKQRKLVVGKKRANSKRAS
jgi:restriction endonuclease S subunit